MSRIQGVEVFRVLIIVVVVYVHALPVQPLSATGVDVFWRQGVVIRQLALFAMPFFFLISGYFWALRVERSKNPMAAAHATGRRIAIVFLGWTLIYLMTSINVVDAFHQMGVLGPFKMVLWSLKARILGQPLTFLMLGTKVHLWFLVAILWALYISAVFVRRGRTDILLVLGLVFYIFGNLGKAYAQTPLGFETSFNTRNGPFFGLLPFATGIFLAKVKSNQCWFHWGIGFFVFGLCMQLLEAALLWKFYRVDPVQDYFFGTYFMGCGLAIASLADHWILRWEKFAALGSATLGVYAIHMVFVDLFQGVEARFDSELWRCGKVAVILLLSYVSVLLLSKNRYTRVLVS